MKKKNPHAVALGRRGGSVSSPKKTVAARENAKLGGRPKKKIPADDEEWVAEKSLGGADRWLIQRIGRPDDLHPIAKIYGPAAQTEATARLIAAAPEMAEELYQAAVAEHTYAVRSGEHIAKTFEECGALPCYRRALILKKAGVL